MKQILLSLSAGALMLVACQTTPDADNAATGELKQAAEATGDTLKMDIGGSSIGWIGTKTGGNHQGNFKLAEGLLTVLDGNIKGGNFTIDVTSLQVTDLAGEDRSKLEGHLKSQDFFLVDSFPTAKFEITGVETFDPSTNTSKLPGATHIISGNLTLRGQTNNVSFPAIVKIDGSKVTAVADFNIDRTNWGLSYKGPNNPADWLIAKEVNLKLDLKANSGNL